MIYVLHSALWCQILWISWRRSCLLGVMWYSDYDLMIRMSFLTSDKLVNPMPARRSLGPVPSGATACNITPCPVARCKKQQSGIDGQADQVPNLPCSANNVSQCNSPLFNKVVGQVEVPAGQVNVRLWACLYVKDAISNDDIIITVT